MPNALPTTQMLDLLWQSRWLVALLLAVGAAKLAFALNRPRILG